MKVDVQNSNFEFYYNNDNTILYNICYINEKGKIYKPTDMESRLIDSLYITDFYFKIQTLEKEPKVSYGLHIFENNKEIDAKINIIKVESEIINNQNP